jgi:hypothetical protein
MTYDELLKIIMNIDPGNESDVFHISQKDYDELKLEFKRDFNSLYTPKEIISIEIKK